MVKIKICSICKCEKDYNSFYARKQSSDGLESMCKQCRQDKNKIRIAAKPDYYKEMRKKSYLKGKVKKAARREIWRKENADAINKTSRQYFLQNQKRLLEIRSKNYDKERIRNKEYFKKNKKAILLKRSEKLKSNVNTKLASILRNRISQAIKKSKSRKVGSAVKDLGCSIEHFIIYIESQFSEGMTWENYGWDSWHIDHKKPLSLFNLEDREQFLEACHYTNLQPLWAVDNLKKGSKLE